MFLAPDPQSLAHGDDQENVNVLASLLVGMGVLSDVPGFFPMGDKERRAAGTMLGSIRTWLRARRQQNAQPEETGEGSNLDFALVAIDTLEAKCPDFISSPIQEDGA